MRRSAPYSLDTMQLVCASVLIDLVDDVVCFFCHTLVGLRHGVKDGLYQICNSNLFLWRLFFWSLSADFKG